MYLENLISVMSILYPYFFLYYLIYILVVIQNMGYIH